MLRLFIAIPLSSESRSAVDRLILKNTDFLRLPLRRTPIANLHLTIQFLGDTEEKRVPLIRESLESLQLTDPAPMHFTEIGAFPSKEDPRVVWLGIAKNAALNSIHTRLTKDMDEKGFPVDKKRFVPHLTLGRANGFVQGFALTAQKLSTISIPDSPLRQVILFKSDLRPGGPVYTPLFSKDLM